MAVGEGVAGGVDVGGEAGVGGGDDHADVGAGEAVDEVVDHQHVGGRNGDGAEFVAGDDAHPEFPAVLEGEHDGVAAADAVGGEDGGGAVGEVVHVGEGEGAHGAVVVGPDEGAAVRLGLGVFGDDVVAEVEARRRVEAEVGEEIGVGVEFGLREEFVFETHGKDGWMVRWSDGLMVGWSGAARGARRNPEGAVRR